MLLPRADKATDEPTPDALAAALAFRLMRLEAMRNAAAQLFTRKRLGRDVFTRGMPEGVRTIRERQFSAVIYDLIKAYAEQRKRTTVKRAHVVKKRLVWSIKDARQRLERMVGTSAAGSWLQLDLFLEQYLPGPELGRTALASSFGATLEMARDGLIEIRQAAPFAPIYMRRRGTGAEWERVG
jgi:segregation and condensation protein A